MPPLAYRLHPQEGEAKSHAPGADAGKPPCGSAAAPFMCAAYGSKGRSPRGTPSRVALFQLCTQPFILHRFCDCKRVPAARKGALRQVLTRSLRCAPGCGFRACPCSLPPPVFFSRTVKDEGLGRLEKRGKRPLEGVNHQTDQDSWTGQLIFKPQAHGARKRRP